ncbi:MAG: hypothetical protein A2015_03440 [Spirochaetes bacterium GWF1_31_7]|nr:MAG: hypothetical protein A2Y30_07525 [Spirochaetes bacterium GWE1_32_154]OHD48433.1 MAG: hypothetical protein A2Y29_05400 [Spirochaetes bacterium GWE2_31_10]OHD50910.1 MAG: hypothetical protein A2015_03440 [Spirochaetes bacterium GWF1_31_7]OHD73350.1 MAG: hypothetical protein A2355_17065 [Spirochaetes bacterium RIFOXYB1_FULL_32_8]HBD92750.1 hypothetical protein [Spirochaetia bacterium]
MLYNDLNKEIQKYRNKIVDEDLEMLSERRKSLCDEDWEIFFDKYCRTFVNKNKILFELLIGCFVPYNQINSNDIRLISLKSSHSVLNDIVNKVNQSA